MTFCKEVVNVSVYSKLYHTYKPLRQGHDQKKIGEGGVLFWGFLFTLSVLVGILKAKTKSCAHVLVHNMISGNVIPNMQLFDSAMSDELVYSELLNNSILFHTGM